MKGYGYAGVPQKVLDQLWMNAAPKEQGGAHVPELVPADGGRPARTSSGLKNVLTTFCASTGPPCCVANLPVPPRTAGSARSDALLHHLYITAGQTGVNFGKRG